MPQLTAYLSYIKIELPRAPQQGAEQYVIVAGISPGRGWVWRPGTRSQRVQRKISDGVDSTNLGLVHLGVRNPCAFRFELCHGTTGSPQGVVWEGTCAQRCAALCVLIRRIVHVRLDLYLPAKAGVEVSAQIPSARCVSRPRDACTHHRLRETGALRVGHNGLCLAHARIGAGAAIDLMAASMSGAARHTPRGGVKQVIVLLHLRRVDQGLSVLDLEDQRFPWASLLAGPEHRRQARRDGELAGLPPSMAILPSTFCELAPFLPERKGQPSQPAHTRQNFEPQNRGCHPRHGVLRGDH